MLLGLATFLFSSAAAPAAMPLQFALQSLDGRAIVRIPARPGVRERQSGASNQMLQERPADDCHRASRVVAARFSQPGTVDLVMRSRRVYRAYLAPDCPPLGYYSAPYLAPGSDGRICAGRDSILSRAGGECIIGSFRRLVPQPDR